MYFFRDAHNLQKASYSVPYLSYQLQKQWILLIACFKLACISNEILNRKLIPGSQKLHLDKLKEPS